MFDPAVEAVLAAVDDYDLLHPIDRLLVESGIRWTVLRHIAVPARVDLARWVLDRIPPERTRAADSSTLWLDAVQDRISAQTGAEFKYSGKRRRWSQIADVLARCADQARRPLTWIPQDEIAATVGCSTRTVRRALAWLRRERLLWEVVPGCQLPQQAAPYDETAAERIARDNRINAAIVAEDTARARARTQLDAVRGHPEAQAAQADEQALPLDMLTTTTAGRLRVEPALVRLAPVYELRVPLDPAELAEAEALAQASVTARGEQQAERLSASQTDQSTHSDEIVTTGNTAELPLVDENGHPPQVPNKENIDSNNVHTVEKRRAPRDSDQHMAPQLKSHRLADTTRRRADKPDRRHRQSEAVRAAGWLLRSRLDPRICDDVSLRWLAAQIRGSHLLDRHGWTWEELADQLHGYPEHPYLPRYIRNCRAWIRARFTRATPHLSPSKLRIIQHIERNSSTLQRQRQTEAEQARRAEITARRAAINTCDLCDELGWIHVPPSTPTARCNHDTDTSGW